MYPRDAIDLEYEENIYFNQYTAFKQFYKNYLGEKLKNLFISYTDLINRYSIQAIDLGFRVDHATLKKIQIFEEQRSCPAKARIFAILIKQSLLKIVSHGLKITHVNVI